MAKRLTKRPTKRARRGQRELDEVLGAVVRLYTGTGGEGPEWEALEREAFSIGAEKARAEEARVSDRQRPSKRQEAWLRRQLATLDKGRK